MINLIIRIFNSIFGKGLTRSFQSLISVIEDYYFDIKYGLDTSEPVKVDDLDITAEDKKHSVLYLPTRIRHFKRLISKLQLPEGSVFVDFGSGKGRILLVAGSYYNFLRVVGVEISSLLCIIARNNISIYENKLKRSLRVEVVESNVLQYNLRDDENVFYFFRPFDSLIMDNIIEKIIASLKVNHRKVWLIINASNYSQLLKNKQIFHRFLYFSYGGAEFAVYSNH